jgi:type II secretory pathway component PulM
MKFRSERERRMVLAGGAAVALILYFFAFLLPALERTRGLETDMATQQARLVEARALARELASLQAAPVQQASGDSVLKILEQTLSSLGITPGQVRPFGADNRGVELRLDKVDGGSLVRLLHALQQAGIRPDSIELADFAGTGLWDVTLTIQGPAATAAR